MGCRWQWLLAAVTLMVSACGPNVGPPTPVPVVPTPLAPPPGSQPAVDQALQNAAARLTVGTSDLHVDQVEARQWPDASLGCPQPGSLYSQIVTPGFLIVISTSSGKQLEYHSDARGRVVLCKES
jgi:hypothetical protein